MGHADPFAFVPEFSPAAGARRLLCGTPPILSLAAFDSALSVSEGVSLPAVRRKSVALSEAFLQRLSYWLKAGEIRLASPPDPWQRGSHLVLAHAQGYAVMQALIAAGVVGDFRAPNLMRFGFTPLFTAHAEVVAAADRLATILATRSWDHPRFLSRQGAVT